MAETTLWTYQDVVEWLLNVFTGQVTGRDQRLARMAAVEAYREFATLHNWSYLQRRCQFATSAQYTTGTVAYDHTGGANERMLTLTTGTWPTWAAFGKVIISNVHYDVSTRESSSIITLSPSSNPGADVASGTSYVLYRDAYPLPVDFQAARSPLYNDAEGGVPLSSSPPEETFAQTALYRTPGDPDSYAIRGDGEYYGSLSIVLSPPPSTAESYSIWYERRPRRLLTQLYSTGTVSVSSSATTVTGSSTVWSANHVGAIIRFSSSSTVPTSPFGIIAGTDNPYVAQRVVTAVASTTSLTIDEAVSSSTSYSAVGYTISDPLDFEHEAMLSLFLRKAEESYARLTARKDLKDRMMMSQVALRGAMAADHRMREYAMAGGASVGAGAPPMEVGTVHLDEV